MKYFLVLLVVCVALAAASPQFLAAWPGYAGVAPVSRTVVAGPTVVNEAAPRYFAPRYFAPGWAGFF